MKYCAHAVCGECSLMLPYCANAAFWHDDGRAAQHLYRQRTPWLTQSKVQFQRYTTKVLEQYHKRLELHSYGAVTLTACIADTCWEV